MLKYIITSSIILLLVDSIYIYTNSVVFANLVENIQKTKFKINIVGAFLSYSFLISGLYYFILRKRCSPFEALILGMVIYGVYDSTNYAMFDKYNPYLGIMDTIWGGILLYITTYITYKIIK